VRYSFQLYYKLFRVFSFTDFSSVLQLKAVRFKASLELKAGAQSTANLYCEISLGFFSLVRGTYQHHPHSALQSSITCAPKILNHFTSFLSERASGV